MPEEIKIDKEWDETIFEKFCLPDELYRAVGMVNEIPIEDIDGATWEEGTLLITGVKKIGDLYLIHCKGRKSGWQVEYYTSTGEKCVRSAYASFDWSKFLKDWKDEIWKPLKA